MQSIADILDAARTGDLEPCAGCPWSPKAEESVGFGVSCRDHGIDWARDGRAVSMIVVQDPGDTTPHETGRLCAVHNAENPTDRTAQQSLRLWNAAVSLRTGDPQHGGYLRGHYWTNSIMHGASDSTGLRERRIMETARTHCTKVLEAQLRALRPKIVIASGAEAAKSLKSIGVMSAAWWRARREFPNGAYSEVNDRWLPDGTIRVFCTYHTAGGVVNRTVASAYEDSPSEPVIARKALALGNPGSVDEFLSTYSSLSSSLDKGMRYLLNHWLDIGLAIREAHESAI